MRNTHLHPVTKQEMLAAIDAAAPSLESDRVGDILPLALSMVRRVIESMPQGMLTHITKP